MSQYSAKNVSYDDDDERDFDIIMDDIDDGPYELTTPTSTILRLAKLLLHPAAAFEGDCSSLRRFLLGEEPSVDPIVVG
jgi:hypothetical protein